MADYVYFKDLCVHDNCPSWMLEDSIRNCAALGGIHDCDFLDAIADTFSGTLSDFWETGTAEGTWAVDMERLKGIGGGDARWYRIYHASDVPPSFVVAFTKQGTRGGFVFCSGAYIAYWDATEVVIASVTDAGVPTILARTTLTVADDTEIAVAVRRQQGTDFDVVDWLSVGVYVLGRCVVAHSEYTGDTVLGDAIGFAVWQSDTAYFDDLRVPELHRIVEWTSVDPAEAIGAGMNRAIGTTPLFYFCRYDGTLRAWIPGNRANDWALPTAREVRKTWLESHFVPCHIRTVGAYHEADEWSQDDAEKQGRATFEVFNDPNLMTVVETAEGAEDALRRVREGRERWSIQMPGSPLVEPQDRVVDGEGDDMRVQSLQFNVEKRGGGAPVFTMQIEASGYIEEEA